jgi:sodium pump decarboxylase gamma subunit
MSWRLIGEGAAFSLTAQLMVFMVLLLLALVLVLMRVLLYRPKKTEEKPAAAPAAKGLEPEKQRDHRKAAAIAAALARHEESSRGLPDEPAPEGPWAPKPSEGSIPGIKARRWNSG